MITTKHGYKVTGYRRVISDYTHVPSGYHVEIWGVVDSDKRTIELYTSEYLTPNSWTTNHADGERRFIPHSWDDRTLTAQLRQWLDSIGGSSMTYPRYSKRALTIDVFMGRAYRDDRQGPLSRRYKTLRGAMAYIRECMDLGQAVTRIYIDPDLGPGYFAVWMGTAKPSTDKARWPTRATLTPGAQYVERDDKGTRCYVGARQYYIRARAD